MRQSRRAALLQALGVRWHKYACNVSTGSYSQYEQSGWVQTGTATHNGTGTSTVYTTCSFSASSGFSIGGAKTVDLSTWSGTYYAGGGTEATMAVDGGYGNTITFYTNTATLKTYYYTTYSKGSTDYGTVRADEGAYPDAKNGYSYVTTFTEDGVKYTVMRYGSNYYCYAQE